MLAKPGLSELTRFHTSTNKLKKAPFRADRLKKDTTKLKSGAKKKKFISLDLLKMATLLKVKPSQLQFDSFMAGNGLGINN